MGVLGNSSGYCAGKERQSFEEREMGSCSLQWYGWWSRRLDETLTDVTSLYTTIIEGLLHKVFGPPNMHNEGWVSLNLTVSSEFSFSWHQMVKVVLRLFTLSYCLQRMFWIMAEWCITAGTGIQIMCSYYI